jgi:hypothetical protein
MDNFFTSYSLLSKLSAIGLRASGVIRNNRICQAPLKVESELRYRGDLHTLCDGVICLVRLHDSKVVTMATNFDSVKPFHQTSRASKSGFQNIQIPNVFHNYNANMGGVDLTNRFVSDYGGRKEMVLVPLY